MKAYAFIPARYHSTRLPGKPLVGIAGKPMIQHVYERALGCKGLAGVCVATDDQRIADCVRGFGGQVVLTAREHLSGTDRICEAALALGMSNEDVVVNIQGDQPLFDPAVIAQLIEPLEQDPTIPMVTLKYRIRDQREVADPNHVKVVTDAGGFALYFSRAPIPFCRDKGAEPVYYKHLGFYAFRMWFLMRFKSFPEGSLESLERLEQLRALEHGFKIKVVETAFDSIEVDVPADVRKVERSLLEAARETV